MLLAQLTDLHVSSEGSSFDLRTHTAEALERAVVQLRSLDPLPPAVLCTGDLANEGRAQEYARLIALLDQLPMPWYPVPGNHDDREALRAALRGRAFVPRDGAFRYLVELDPLRVIALDTLVPGEPGGRLGDEQLAWLDARPSESPRQPTILMMHHPPFATGLAGMDAMGLADGAALEQVVRRHPQVERILCGHLHRPITRRFAGTVASTCPSTGPQVELDLRPGDPTRMVSEPSAYQLHLWIDGGLTTHTAYVQS